MPGILAYVLHDPDAVIRAAAFISLRRLMTIHGDSLTYGQLREGFEAQGKPMLFLTRAKGIFRPAGMTTALSVMTPVQRAGRSARYDDHQDEESGEFIYRFRGADPAHPDNRLLIEAQRLQLPLIYFVGVSPGRYRPLWPVFVVSVDLANMSCRLQADEQMTWRAASELLPMAADAPEESLETAIRRRYVTRLAKYRVHQSRFRDRVLDAYANRCAVCRFPRRELLEGAHIVPDSDPRGIAEVRNGLALCRLHHGVFDRHLLGVRPDRTIELSERLLATRDGPTFESALKPFHGERLVVPRDSEKQPDSQLLEIRYESFRAAGKSRG